jgi:hypothetical protein
LFSWGGASGPHLPPPGQDPCGKIASISDKESESSGNDIFVEFSDNNVAEFSDGDGKIANVKTMQRSATTHQKAVTTSAKLQTMQKAAMLMQRSRTANQKAAATTTKSKKSQTS